MLSLTLQEPMENELDVLNITPISSHSLSARPIVLSSDKNITIKFTDKFIDAAVTIDGQERIDLYRESSICIKKANHSAVFVNLPFNNYISTLKEKQTNNEQYYLVGSKAWAPEEIIDFCGAFLD